MVLRVAVNPVDPVVQIGPASLVYDVKTCHVDEGFAVDHVLEDTLVTTIRNNSD